MNLQISVNSEPLIRMDHVSKAYAGVQALRHASFDLYAGEVHALVGENGAGKSTLIKIITGAVEPDSGRLEIAGRLVQSNNPVLSRELGIAAIYQHPALFPQLSVSENIALGLEAGGPWRTISRRRRKAQAKLLLDRIGARIDPETEVKHLTMPEQQLVEIARALGSNARVVIMDEPTSSLSDQEVANLFRVIQELKADGVGIIYISHRLEELSQVADRVTALRDGVIVGTKSMNETSRADLIRMMVGRDLSAIFPKKNVEIGSVVLELEGIGCRGAGIHGIHLTLRAGEILGLTGLIGAGRTELAKVLFGLTPSDRGNIFLAGKPVTLGTPGDAISQGIAYVPEDRRRHGVVLEMSVAHNMTLAMLKDIASRGMIHFSQERSIVQNSMERFGVKASSMDASVGSLSGGNQQKVAVARWLNTKPKILILDEPTQGVDVGAKSEIHRLMCELAAEGMAILMISSEMPEILGMSDRIAVMYAGTIVATVDRAGLTQEKLLELALGHPEAVGSQVG